MVDCNKPNKSIEIWRIKKLIKALESAKGNGTSMISLIMPPGDQIPRVAKMLEDEFETVSNTKGMANHDSVLAAITSAQQRLKVYNNKVPPNGLVLYTGTLVREDAKEKEFTIDFEPFKPISASLYLRDNKFHTEALNELLESDVKVGFIVMDGSTTVFGTVSGNVREVLHKFSVEKRKPFEIGECYLPVCRYDLGPIECCYSYRSKTAELAKQFFVEPTTGCPNIYALVIAVLTKFDMELRNPSIFDHRLQHLMQYVNVSCGGENGFNQAIELRAEYLACTELFVEERWISYHILANGLAPKKYVLGMDDTLKALEMGAVETLVVWENLDIQRYTLKNTSTGEIMIKHIKEQDANQSNFRDVATGAQLEVEDKIPLLEWFADEYMKFGCKVKFVTDKSQVGCRFCQEFGGIGAVLHSQVSSRMLNQWFDDAEYGDGSKWQPINSLTM